MTKLIKYLYYNLDLKNMILTRINELLSVPFLWVPERELTEN